ncbi:dynamin family protein [Domibacillus robiginosus]|uniref:dynamin family protein n=1 Tax=Domibacillus robiginosus TaxID=1071054 RepID=UPI00067BD4CD|nr:dynamin family protein [Domibacillus robiginosus]
MSVILHEKVDKATSFHFKNQLYIKWIEAFKSALLINFKLKQRMSIMKRHQLEKELKKIELQAYFATETIELLRKETLSESESRHLNKLLDYVERVSPLSEDEINACLKNFDVQKYNEWFSLKCEKMAQNSLFNRLNEDYACFLENLNLKNHPIQSKNLEFRKSYVEALAAILNHLAPAHVENAQIFANKLGISETASLKTLQEIKHFCAPRLILSADHIERESWNTLLLTETMLLVPKFVHIGEKINNELLINLKLNTQEVEEIIQFTNLLKAEVYQYADVFTKITKYSDLALYVREFQLQAFKVLEPNHKILVVGTMSAGKSTFLNSLLGYDFFPSKNEACTAKVFEYSVTDRSQYLVWKEKTGEPEVFDEVTSDVVAHWNDSEPGHTLYIQGPARAAVQTNKNLTFIDTPGPNNSMDVNHRTVMEQAIGGEYEKIFYILNSTQLGTDDDVVLLQLVQDVLKEAPHKQIYFIVNKVDEFDNNETESVKVLKENVLRYLQAKGFEQPNVLFVSALAAKLVQNEVNGLSMTRKERNQLRFFRELMLEEEYDLSQYAQYTESYLQNNVQFAENITEQQKELLLHSGMVEVIKCL